MRGRVVLRLGSRARAVKAGEAHVNAAGRGLAWEWGVDVRGRSRRRRSRRRSRRRRKDVKKTDIPRRDHENGNKGDID